MTDIRFYHMLHKRLEQALPEIVAKALERKYKIVIKAGSRERVEAIDAALWTHDPGSFLPHGHIRDGFEAEQPIWLTTEDENPNAANMLVLTDGADSEMLGKFELCCTFFDGNDPEAVEAARARWKTYKEAGHALVYYQQTEAGKWEQRQ